MIKRRLAPLVLAVALLAQPATAQQLELTEQEMATVARIGMPAAFRSLQAKCDPMLDSNAYIYARGEALHRRLLSVSNAAASGASRVIASVTARSSPAMGEIVGGMPPEVLRPYFDEMVAGMLTREIQTENCAAINRALELIEPLPAENLADLLALAYTQEQTEQRATR